MKTIKNYFLSSAAFVFIACGGATDNSNNENNSQNEETKQSTSGNSAKYNTKCFEAFEYDYSKILTKEDVLKHVSVADPNVVEVKFKERSIKEFNEHSIEWPSDRPDQSKKVKTGPTTMEIPFPDNNNISFAKISFKEDAEEEVLQRFNNAYAQLTAEQYKQAEERIEQANQDKTAEERNAMKSLIKARQQMSYHPVANLGSSAYWMSQTVDGIHYGVELYVLAGTVEFQINVKVSADDQENARVATLLAQEVLDKCK